MKIYGFQGFKVGFVAWIGMLINKYYHYLQEQKSQVSNKFKFK